MIRTSHRLRTEERRANQRLFRSVALVIAGIVGSIYIGIPLIPRILEFRASGTRNQGEDATASTRLILPPVLNPLPPATNAATIRVAGYAQASATVELTLNGKQQETMQTNDDGTFTSYPIRLEEGENTLTARTIVSESDKSEDAQPMNILFKKSQPKLTISSPNNGEEKSGEEKNVMVRGETDAGNKVTINDRIAIVDQYGKFQHVFPLPEGESTISIVASDPAGNTVREERKVSYAP